jgi:hypothetical protein
VESESDTRSNRKTKKMSDEISNGVVAVLVIIFLVIAMVAINIGIQATDSMKRIERQLNRSLPPSDVDSTAYAMGVIDKLMDSGEAGKITIRVDGLEIPLDSKANFVRLCKNVTSQTNVLDSKWTYVNSPIAPITMTDPKLNPYITAEYMPSYYATQDVVEEVCETIMTNASIHLNGETNAIKFRGEVEITYGKTAPNQTEVRVEII